MRFAGIGDGKDTRLKSSRKFTANFCDVKLGKGVVTSTASWIMPIALVCWMHADGGQCCRKCAD